MTTFIDPGSVAHGLLVLSIVIAAGLALGVSFLRDAALDFADSIKSSNAPAIAYSAVYPAVMISRILLARLLVSFFS